ncbi:MAG: WYL domain-containing protein [Snowella sp.]|nr:WYL domain-containing protein [Snowella sp.]
MAFCTLRQEFRDFRLDRIREYRLLNQTFERDPKFNLQEYRKNCFQMEQGDRLYKFVIEFSAKAAPFIRERRWHLSQEIDENADGSLTLRMEVGGLQEVKRWVLGYGKGALAKSPPELVELLRKETQAMARQNETGDFE